MEKYNDIQRRYNEKETKLFSQSFIGYWITKSPLSIICRIFALGLVFISTYISYISTFTGYYQQVFLIINGFSIIFSMFVFGLYLSVSIFLSLKHAKALCSNSPFTLLNCVNYAARFCIKVAAASTLGLGIIPIDWTCEKAGVKPIFMWLYYPGLKRLAGEITPALASQPSKDLVYVNSNIPGSSLIYYLQNKTAAAEAKLAADYIIQEQKKKDN